MKPAKNGLLCKVKRFVRGRGRPAVADMCGITPAALCKIERGDTDVKLSTLALIRSALALNITITTM